jgi:hypothetical protein
MSDDRTEIAWVPHDGGYSDEGEPWLVEGVPFTTFGTGTHTEGLVCPEGITLDIAGLDPEIADLVIALNKAGIKTVQSCQEISGTAREDFEDVPRMGIVVVAWETFPLVAATLPGIRERDGVTIPAGAGTGGNHGDGWLFAADSRARYVSVIFPWRDHDAWLASVTAT